MTSSTISGNHADANGGGLYLTNFYGVFVGNSTVSGNEAVVGGAMVVGIFTQATIVSSTVTANRLAGPHLPQPVGGVVVAGGTMPTCVMTAGSEVTPAACSNDGIITVTGSIVAGNQDADFGGWMGASVTIEADHSLLGQFDAAAVSVVDAGGSHHSVTAAQLALDPLADNGGPTLTHALLPGSIAIDAGPSPVPSFTGSEWDQRGEGYARVVNGLADVGAFEVQPPKPEPEPEPTFTG